MTGSSRRRSRDLALAALILLGALALRAWNLTAQSIWFDEGVAIYAAAHPLAEIAAADPTNPPLYYYLLHLWMALVGRSDFAVRALPVLLGMLLVAGAWALARRWFSPAAGAVAGLLAGASPFLWWYAQEARMYNLVGLEVLALIVVVDRLHGPAPDAEPVKTPVASPNVALPQAWPRRLRNAPLWGAALALEVAALLTHNLGPAVAVWLNLALVVPWLRARRRRALAGWLAAQAALAALMAPWLLGRRQLVSGLSSVTYSPPTPGDLLAGWESLFAGSWALVGDDALLLAAARTDVARAHRAAAGVDRGAAAGRRVRFPRAVSRGRRRADFCAARGGGSRRRAREPG